MQTPDPCILCAAVEARIIHQKDRWQYLCCQSCKLVSLHPRPTPRMLMEQYRDYLPDRPEDIGQWEAMMKPVVAESANLIVSRSKTGGRTILDIGCGYGFFLHQMKSRGWQATGIEVSATGRQYARQKFGIHVFSEPLQNLSLAESAFDVVTLFYVIEHVFDPLDLLRRTHRVLKPGGLVLLRWPHTTPLVRMLGPLSKKLDLYHTPYHLYDFSPKTIATMLHLSGFKSIETLIAGHTLPAGRLNRWSSRVFGRLGDCFSAISNGRILLPGVSKTTLGFK